MGGTRQDNKKQVIKGESYRQRVRKTEKEALVTILCIHQSARVPRITDYGLTPPSLRSLLLSLEPSTVIILRQELGSQD